MKRTIPSVWGIVIVVLFAALVYFVWQGSFWGRMGAGNVPVAGKILTGVEPPKTVLQPTLTPQPSV